MMKTQFYSAKVELKDEKAKNDRRFRNILANSGEIMESGEVRELDDLYVMGRDGNLIKISDLNPDPEKQTENYSVKAQADHGELIDGELVPSIEKQFGSCRVWLGKDGLHARMYFADNDKLADHAWAISEDASYSTGIDWYPDGYYGTGYEIDHAIGILREISMVLTGNDPRALTIDHKPETSEAVVRRNEEEGDGNNNNNKGDDEMSELKDELTREESEILKEQIVEAVDKVTADIPESETEPTRASKDEEETPAEEVKEEKKDTLKSPVVIIRDKVAKQEVATSNDWLHSKEGHRAFADTLRKAGRMGAEFNALWRAEASKHMSLDGITGLPNPANVTAMFESALGNSDGIISHFNYINTKSLAINMLAAASDEGGRAKGHKKGEEKQNQELTDTVRNVLNKMVYKRLDLDAMEIYENPELIDFRSQELVENIIKEIERAAIIGDGRSAGTPDLRLFDGDTNRGFFSIAADAAATEGFGSYVAGAVAVDGNLYDGVVTARGSIRTEGSQFIVAKPEAITALLTAKANGQYLVPPASRIEDMLGVTRVYTPSWMANAEHDAYLIVDNAYHMIGESQVRVRPDFDTTTNTDILLDETPRGGSLAKYKSAIAITLGGESE